MPKTFSDDTIPTATQKIPSESVEGIDATQTDTVASGTDERTIVRPPSGYIYEALNIEIRIEGIDNATSGTHKIGLYSEKNWVDFVFAESTYDYEMRFVYGYWEKADVIQHPSTAAAQSVMISGMRASENNGFLFSYSNKTDGDQTNDRVYLLSVRKIKVL